MNQLSPAYGPKSSASNERLFLRATACWLTASFVLLPAFATSHTITVPDNYGSIQDAIDAAQDGDAVFVRDGEYQITRPITFLGKSIRLVSENGPEWTIIRMMEPDDPRRGSVIIFENGEVPDAIVEGFTITGGRGSLMPGAPKGTASHGGGIFANRASPTITRNTITENRGTTGAGIEFLHAHDCSVSDNTIENNLATDFDAETPGAGFAQCSNVRIERNTIRWNRSGIGALVLVECFNTFVAGNTITGNDAGISLIEGGFNVLAHNVISMNNFGGVLISEEWFPEFAWNTVEDNVDWTRGAGLWLTGGKARIVHNRFVGNKVFGAFTDGGGVYLPGGGGLDDVAFIFAMNLVAKNYAEGEGGGISITGPTYASLIYGCTIYGNSTGGVGGGVAVGDPDFYSTTRMVNCLIGDNTGGPPETGASGYLGQSTEVGSYNAFFPLLNSGGQPQCPPDYWNTIVCLDDPSLADPAVGDFHLRPDSPAIDSGDPAWKDPDGSPSDLGAFPMNHLPVDCPGIWNVRCDHVGGDVRIIWWNAGSYETVKVERDGVLVGTFPGDAEVVYDRGVSGRHIYRLTMSAGGFECPPVDVTAIPNFVMRGDVNLDGSVDIADAIAILFYLFGGIDLPCRNAADVYLADHKPRITINISDVVFILKYLFMDGPEPGPPFPRVGFSIYPPYGLPCE
jgi:parallel beta-helix repeat protein